ncbi:MAG: hypothetical protein N5P05_001593 [Chroococcopsis gigantea SAG 12.99]|jgi:hypothetical protein|nr:hypothetical protein [Chroococcopsis gigantea SAG 12.99]
MLAYILALLVGFFSLYLLATAFIKPVIHRKDDFLWSAVGLFYALVLWLCAPQFKGAILLGQAAVVILLIGIGWQNLSLRAVILSPDKQGSLLGFSVIDWLQGRLGRVVSAKPKKSPVSVKPPEKAAPKVTHVSPGISTPPAPEPVKEEITPAITESKVESTPVETIKPLPVTAEIPGVESNPVEAIKPVVETDEEELDKPGESELQEKEEVTYGVLDREETLPEEVDNSPGEMSAVTETVAGSIVVEREEIVAVTVETDAEMSDAEIVEEIIEALESTEAVEKIESVEIISTETIYIDRSPENEGQN